MNIISSRTDIATYVANTQPGNVDPDSIAFSYVIDAIQSASHPAYGEDWGPWLDQYAEQIALSVPGVTL